MRREANRACPCGQRITHQSKTGYCRPCAIQRLHADPAYQARRLAGLQRYYDTPGAREASGERLRAYRANMPEQDRERRREHGRWLVREFLSKPDVRARAQSTDARERAIAGNVRAKLGWCPPELRELYDHLVYSKRLRSSEARRLVEAEIPGTREHAKRTIASTALASRLRDERRKREAY